MFIFTYQPTNVFSGLLFGSQSLDVFDFLQCTMRSGVHATCM